MDGNEELEPQGTYCSFDFVVDAIDSVDDKAALISACTFVRVDVSEKRRLIAVNS